jgi:glycosyltransferase involved in cell wall biosynthesis
MTVLFMTRKFPPSVGGMENFAYNLYVSLDKKADTKLIKWGGSNKYLPAVLPYFFLRAFWLLLRGTVDIVHAQDVVVAPIGYSLSRLFHKPFAVVVHGLDITFRNKLYQAINVRCVAKADIVFCISQAAADEAIKRGVDEAKIKVIPLGITDNKHASKDAARGDLHKELEVDEGTPVLLTVGRLVERKGVAWFVANVMPKLVEKYPRLLYLVVGDGADRDKIKAGIEQKKLPDNVKMLGRVEDEKMATLYNGADVFVQPNIVVPGDIEGFGLVLLEASLCELPVVAAGIEGIKDAITSGQNGVLVESKNVAGFVHEISEMIGDSKFRCAFGAKSREYTLDHFQWTAIADEYLEGYRSITSK